MSQSFNTAGSGTYIDAMHINEVCGLVPILHIAEFVLYCRLVPNLCTILNYVYVRYPDGQECTASLQDLAPCPEPNEQYEPRDEAPPATEIVDRPEEIPADTPTPSTSPKHLPGLLLHQSTHMSHPPTRLIEEI